MKAISNKWILISILISLLTASQVKADFDKTKWQFCKPIEGQSSSALGYITLDTEALLNSNPGYADLRVIDNQGKETPFKLIESTGEAEIESTQATATNITSLPGKYSSITLNLGKRMPSNRLLINTPDHNFTCRVEVAGMNETGTWEVLRDDAYIFDFSRGNNARSAEVTYPECDYSTLRVRIFADNKRVIKASGATIVWKQPTTRKSTVLYDGKGTIRENTKDKTTEISLKLKGSNIPSGSIQIFSPAINYQRNVEVMGSRNGKDWTFIGDGYVLEYKAAKFNGEISNIGFSGGNYSRIKVVIHNEDNDPIPVNRLVIGTQERQLAFTPRTGTSYKLFYGCANAMYPNYDIQSLYGYISNSGLVKDLFILGPQETNPDYVKIVVTKPWLEANPWVIWVAMIAVMVVLIAFVLKLARQIKAGTPPS